MEDMIITVPDEGSPDLDVFRRSDPKMPWSERVQLIKQQFPSTVTLDWNQVFIQDPAVLGRIINDILKADQAQPGRPGKRPALDVAAAEERYRQMTGEDFTMLPFHESFKILKGKRSIRHMAHKTDLDKTLVWGLLNGDKRPNPEIMEKVAAAFGKHPSYFVEYRVDYILGVLFYKLINSPESSVVFFKKLQGRENKRL